MKSKNELSSIDNYFNDFPEINIDKEFDTYFN